MMRAREVTENLKRLGNKQKVTALSRFFKTGKGEYGEGDRFLGIPVPVQRTVARSFRDLPMGEIRKLLRSPIHECRLTALLILVSQFERASETEKKRIYRFYLAHTRYINNWDLVDLTAPRIVGSYLMNRDRAALITLARSENLWERRIAVLSTFAFIRNGDLTETDRIAEMLLSDRHDLIHKAVGWMLREAGKRNERFLRRFLQKHARVMPRTMLRYATERLNQTARQSFL